MVIKFNESDGDSGFFLRMHACVSVPTQQFLLTFFDREIKSKSNDSKHLVQFTVLCGIHLFLDSSPLPRDTMGKRGNSCGPVSVCPSVRPSHSCIVPKLFLDHLAPSF